jgi:hypothetical protein
MRELVHGRCGKLVAGAQAAQKLRREQKRAIVMNRGITEVGSNGVSSALRSNALEVLRDFVKRLVPPDALPAISSAANRILQPVLVVVNIL